MASFLNLKMLVCHQILDSILVANECVDSYGNPLVPASSLVEHDRYAPQNLGFP